MRTAIFLGLLYVGDCIGAPSSYSGASIVFVGIFCFVFMAMDVVDFFRGKK